MEWKRIETYDALGFKPKLAVFWFEGVPPVRGGKGKYSLPPCMQLTRTFGFRVCTHWMPLPDAPNA